MTRRSHFGSVRKRASGRWQATFWHAGRLHSGPHTFKTRADASAYLSAVETDIRRGAWIDRRRGDVLFADYAEQWLAERVDLRPRSRETYRGLLDRYLIPGFGATPIGAIAPSVVRSWHAAIATRHESTAAKAYRLLSTICSTAVADEVIAKTPCRIDGAGAEHPAERPTVSVAEVEVLTREMPERMRLIVELAVWCGLRQGELLALRRMDIDQLHQRILVRRSAQQMRDGTVVYGPPKTDAGMRTVCYPSTLKMSVQYHLDRFVSAEPESVVFTGVKGGALRPHVLFTSWKMAREAIARPELHFHDLRHTGATWAATVGATTKELMGRLGHASPLAALRYQHATADRDAVIAEALAELAAPNLIVLDRGRAVGAQSSVR